MSEVSTKNRIIWDTNERNMWITKLVALLIFQILRYNDVITIPYRKNDLIFDIRVSKFMWILIFNTASQPASQLASQLVDLALR